MISYVVHEGIYTHSEKKKIKSYDTYVKTAPSKSLENFRNFL